MGVTLPTQFMGSHFYIFTPFVPFKKQTNERQYIDGPGESFNNDVSGTPPVNNDVSGTPPVNQYIDGPGNPSTMMCLEHHL